MWAVTFLMVLKLNVGCEVIWPFSSWLYLCLLGCTEGYTEVEQWQYRLLLSYTKLNNKNTDFYWGGTTRTEVLLSFTEVQQTFTQSFYWGWMIRKQTFTELFERHVGIMHVIRGWILMTTASVTVSLLSILWVIWRPGNETAFGIRKQFILSVQASCLGCGDRSIWENQLWTMLLIHWCRL